MMYEDTYTAGTGTRRIMNSYDLVRWYALYDEELNGEAQDEFYGED